MEKRRQAKKVMLKFFIFIFLLGCVVAKRNKVRLREAVIMKPPHDIPVAKCGDEIRLSCVAEGEPSPEIEWWFHGKRREDKPQKTIIKNAQRDGRIKIKFETFTVVRSTLLIVDAEEGDEGIYQCRASNSKLRRKSGINLYQHWKIEQAPVSQIKCKEAVTMQTQVFTTSGYNDTVLDDVINRTMTSFSTDDSTTAILVNAKEKLDPDGPLPEPPKHTQAVTSRSMTSLITKQSLKPMKPNKKGNSVEKSPPKKDSRNMIEKEKPKKTNEIGDNIDRQMAEESLTTKSSGGGNSGQSIGEHSWLLLLMHIPLTAFLIVTSHV